jgi:hypothetical protein
MKVKNWHPMSIGPSHSQQILLLRIKSCDVKNLHATGFGTKVPSSGFALFQVTQIIQINNDY